MSEQRVALVTGAFGGIGTAIREALAAEGLLVVAADLPGAGSGEALELDLRSGDSCRAAVAAIVERHGRLDVLVNNAGINARGASAEMPEEIWSDIVEVNLKGTFRMCQSAFPVLRDTPGSAVVNLSSTAALVGIAGTGAYAMTKAGISQLTKVLAVEWAPYDVRVNAVAPTIVPSPMTADVLSDPAYMEAKMASIPLGRMATAEDVASAVIWLAGPGAAMTTGLSLPVDGGVAIL
jgi:NAD(P)-dependent dehydrogenase (short-subunit alcohol dehydrogenase family)